MKTLYEHLIKQHIVDVNTQMNSDLENLNEPEYWKKLFTGENINNPIKAKNTILKYICCYFMKKQALSNNKTFDSISMPNIQPAVYNITKKINEYGIRYSETDINDIIRKSILTNISTDDNWYNNITPVLKKIKNVKWVNKILSEHKNFISK